MAMNNAVRCSKLPIQLIYRPPPTLRDLLVSSRPYENQCLSNTCSYCTDGSYICGLRNTVYKLTCIGCGEFYIGESRRSLRERLNEHARAFKTSQSYPNGAFSKHRTLRHAMEAAPRLHVEILHKNIGNTAERKIREALEIRKQKPPINGKEEMKEALKLLFTE